MEQKAISAVAGILSEWNPLGPGARNYSDLDGYRREAIEILFELQIRPSRRHAQRIVMEVINQAFHLALTADDCGPVTVRILAILDGKQ